MKITRPEKPKQEELDKLLVGLKAYNASHIGKYEEKKVATFVKSANGDVIGGAFSVINWGWLHIEWLWCHACIRKQGYGTKLIKEMESYALSQNIKHIKLETTDFQALGFYKKNGYEVFGELENCPINHSTYYLKKTL